MMGIAVQEDLEENMPLCLPESSTYQVGHGILTKTMAYSLSCIGGGDLLPETQWQL